MVDRPQPGEFNAYYQRYVDLVPEGPLVETLRQQLSETVAFLRTIPEERAEFRYAQGKWSVKEVIGHMCDTERIMAYRLLRAARADKTPLAGFDENDFVEAAGFDARSLASLVQEYEAVRRSTIALAEGLADEAWKRVGIANGNEVSARALGYILAGHGYHHMSVIRERYL